MSLNDLYLTVSIVVIVAGAIWGGTRVLNTALRNRREARESRVQKRIEFLREQLALLQKATSDFSKYSAMGMITRGEAEPILFAKAMAKAAIQAVGDPDLNTIADRLETPKIDFENDLKAMGDGIKHLAMLIANEAKK